MASREDIIDGRLAEDVRSGLIYTKKCGWVDLGHARPDNARRLWDQIHYERGPVVMMDVVKPEFSLKSLADAAKANKSTASRIYTFREEMSAHGVSIGVKKTFLVRKGLSLTKKREVALAIFLNVSIDFESLQGSWPCCWFTDSGFSGEDLVSNVIGFYRALNPAVNYLKLCEPVSKKEALAIWDKFKPIGSYKNRVPRPMLFHTGSIIHADMPAFLNQIKPAKPGYYYRELSSSEAAALKRHAQ